VAISPAVKSAANESADHASEIPFRHTKTKTICWIGVFSGAGFEKTLLKSWDGFGVKTIRSRRGGIF
jgi:hypothetical protein